MQSWIESAGMGTTVAVFAVGAVFVWLAGARLSRYADVISAKTGLGQVFVGVLFLGFATSLPEIATTVGAVLEGAPALAGSNLLGGVAMQIAVLAAIDGLALRDRALTHFSGHPAFLMQGVFLALLLALAVAGISIGDVAVLPGVGAWTLLLAGVYVAALVVLYRYDSNPRWEPVGTVPGTGREKTDAAGQARKSLGGAVLAFCVAGVVVFVSGYAVALSGARLAEQTGMGETFVGATLVALATSLPEVSTTWSAVRMRAYALAVGNILGTNALEVALFLPADILHRDGLILASMSPQAAFVGALGIVLTCIYLWGVLERRDRTVFGLGIDSAVVLVTYVAGMLVLFIA